MNCSTPYHPSHCLSTLVRWVCYVDFFFNYKFYLCRRHTLHDICPTSNNIFNTLKTYNSVTLHDCRRRRRRRIRERHFFLIKLLLLPPSLVLEYWRSPASWAAPTNTFFAPASAALLALDASVSFPCLLPTYPSLYIAKTITAITDDMWWRVQRHANMLLIRHTWITPTPVRVCERFF